MSAYTMDHVLCVCVSNFFLIIAITTVIVVAVLFGIVMHVINYSLIV